MTNQTKNTTTTQAEQYAQKYYGITAKATVLDGYEDFNFRLKTDDGKTYILKISRYDVEVLTLDFQTEILKYLADKTLPFELPKTVKNLKGEAYFSFQDEDGRNRWMRMNTWVDGRMIFEAKYHAADLLENWGEACGELYEALKDFDHEAAHKSHDWDLSMALKSREFRQYIHDEKELEIADYFWNLFEKTVLPIYPKLPKSIIHNDLNDYNVLINQNANRQIITGIIDFGDAIYTHRINGLAIAIAYAILDKPNPLEAAANLVKGYHKITPLQDEELQILYALVAGRLTTTISKAAKNHHFEPEKTYLFVSEKPAWNALELWYNLHPNLAYYTFRNACGLEPCPKRILFDRTTTLQSGVKDIKDLITTQESGGTCHLDLSIGSLDLGNNENFQTARHLQKRIDDILWEKNATVGVGGYGEIRPFYNTDAYILPSNNGRQWRTVHLGLDVWTTAGTPVFAAFDGTVFSLKDNKGDDNYGPTIILEHCVKQDNEDLIFYTLYGHLSPISEDLKVGQTVQKGDEIATIGTFPQNGNWAEHLHFQVILDMLGQTGDFYGVCTPNDKAVWLSICPPVAAALAAASVTAALAAENIEQTAAKAAATGDTNTAAKAAVTQKRHQFLGKNLSLSYQEPLHILRGYKQYLYDENGRRYLDTVNNVPHVGHQHPAVVRAAKRQIEVLNTNTRYLHENIVNYAEALLATFPPELCVCYFVNSGSEANELALRMAKTVTNQDNMIAVEVGYHGNTNETIAVSSYKFDAKGGSGKPAKTQIVPMPDTFRGRYKNVETAGELYAKYVEIAIENVQNQNQNQNQNIAGFICESILSCGGQIVLPPNYLKTVYELVRKSGGVCIADEVQVGFGRVGETFWGFELQGVVPDIVTMGKPMGNGHPLAAVVTTRKVAEAFNNGMEYFNTFGGNPVSCAIGQAVLKVIETENLQQNALAVGNYLKEKLNDLKAKFPIIGDVRGHGLFLGIELIRMLETLEPADTEADYIVNRMKENAILMSTDGPFHNVLKIKPPMCFSFKDADFLVETLERVLNENFF